MPREKPVRLTIPPGEILVFASHPRSFDSRYFGAIPKGSVIASVRPLWSFGKER
jgi:type IV secretory pathway protease TraF